MPPRYAYWTILIDNKPTAFRAREKEVVLPTLHQLRRTNTDVVLKWFARGRLWETPEAAQGSAAREKRASDWRPGGAHKDPRDRFKKGGKRRHESPRPRNPSQPRRAELVERREADPKARRDQSGPPPGSSRRIKPGSPERG